MFALRLFAACALTYGAFAPESTPAPASHGIAWRGDYDAALKEAAAAKKPLFIAFLMDDEPANDEIARGHFSDTDIVALSKEFVCMVASIGAHGGGTGGDPAQADICPKYGGCSCRGHRDVETRARDAFLDSPRVVTPQFLFVRSDGKTVVLRHLWTLPAGELAKKMRTAIALCDPSKADAALAEQRKLVDGWFADAAGNNASKRGAALSALASSDDPRVAEFLAKQTAEGVDDVKRIEAVAAIADFGRSNGGLLPVLHKLLASPSVRFRSHVAVALEKIGAPDSGPALAAALRKETKDRAKAALLRALAVCDGVTPAHKKAIVAAAKAGGQIERTAALRAMADLDLGTEGEAVVMAALKDGSGPVRATAYFAAAKQNVKGALQIVEKQAAGEKASEIRQVAEAALAGLRDGAFDSATAGGLLKPYLSDEDLR
jgi:hypothetical protein